MGLRADCFNSSELKNGSLVGFCYFLVNSWKALAAALQACLDETQVHVEQNQLGILARTHKTV